MSVFARTKSTGYVRPTKTTLTRPHLYCQAVSRYPPRPGVEGGDGLVVVVVVASVVVEVGMVVVVVGSVVVVVEVAVVVVVVVVAGNVVVVGGCVVVAVVDDELPPVPGTEVVVGIDVETTGFDVVGVEVVEVVVARGMVTAVGPG